MRTVLLIDVYNLAWSTALATLKLSSEGKSIGVIYSFLRQLLAIGKRFRPWRTVFVADSPISFRKEIFPSYKEHRRRELPPDEERARKIIRAQIDELVNKWSNILGFKILVEEGLEADDIMASLSEDLANNGYFVVCSTTDNDLWQIIKDNVVIWHNKRKEVIDKHWLMEEKGVTPEEWALVKEIAGCSTDGVPGIKGVGEATAIKFIKGQLKPSSKTYKKIVSPKGQFIRERNRQLVKLPFKKVAYDISGLPPASLQGFKALCNEYGFKSLLEKASLWESTFCRQ